MILIPVKIEKGLFSTEWLVELPDQQKIYCDKDFVTQIKGQHYLNCSCYDKEVVVLPNGNGMFNWNQQ